MENDSASRAPALGRGSKCVSLVTSGRWWLGLLAVTVPGCLDPLIEDPGNHAEMTPIGVAPTVPNPVTPGAAVPPGGSTVPTPVTPTPVTPTPVTPTQVEPTPADSTPIAPGVTPSTPAITPTTPTAPAHSADDATEAPGDASGGLGAQDAGAVGFDGGIDWGASNAETSSGHASDGGTLGEP